ncbi:MAG: hypothetical protein ACK5MS_22420, partial [Planctomyces sp.]
PAFPSRLRVRPTLRKPRPRSGNQQSAGRRGQISGWKARATCIRVHSWFNVTPACPSRRRVFA